MREASKCRTVTDTDSYAFSFINQSRQREDDRGSLQYMTKVEVPTSVTLYVQWVLHPFEKPQVAEQKSANSKWVLAQIKELLGANSIDSNEVKIAMQSNGKVLLEIANPDMEVKDGKEFWEVVLESLKQSSKIESISVYVNNEASEKIATNLADRVSRPWHQEYQGHDSTTIIYHK